MEANTRQKNLFHRLLENESPLDQFPVFIVGFPRSGTTLLQSLVATQGFTTFPETHFFGVLLPQLEQKENLVVSSTDKICQVIKEKISLSSDAKNFIADVNKNGIDIKILFEIIVMDQILKQYDINDFKTIFWLEKTPGHAYSMEQIAEYYPDAKFIFIMRNPLHAFSSWRSVSSGWGDNRVPVENHCGLWRYYFQSAETFKEKNPHSVLFVKLEDLVENTVAEMKKITAFLHIDFDEEKLQKRDEVVKQIILPSEVWKEDVSHPIDKSIAERKDKNNLTPFEAYRVSNNLSDLLSKYHYTIHSSYLKNDSSSFMSLIQDVKYHEEIENGEKKNIQLVHSYNEWIKKDPKICQKQKDTLKQIQEAMKNVHKYRFSKHPIKKLNAINKLISLYNLVK